MLAQLIVTVVVMSLVTALAVAYEFRALSIRERESGEPAHHQAGNQAIMVGSILAALAYTPLLLWFVWELPWWIALSAALLTPIIGMPGFLLALPLMPLAQWLLPELDDQETESESAEQQ